MVRAQLLIAPYHVELSDLQDRQDNNNIIVYTSLSLILAFRWSDSVRTGR